MQFDFLADRRKAIPTIASWYREEWGFRLRGDTLETSIERLSRYLNRDKIPFILVATTEENIIGCAQLKYREMADQFPEKEHWIGGVFVAPEYRDKGLGARIIEETVTRAKANLVSTLHLQTERLDGGLYLRLGWQPVVQVNNHGLEVLVMERHIGAEPA